MPQVIDASALVDLRSPLPEAFALAHLSAPAQETAPADDTDRGLLTLWARRDLELHPLEFLAEGHFLWVQVCVWQKVPDAFRAHADDEAVVRARNEAIWVTGTK